MGMPVMRNESQVQTHQALHHYSLLSHQRGGLDPSSSCKELLSLIHPKLGDALCARALAWIPTLGFSCEFWEFARPSCLQSKSFYWLSHLPGSRAGFETRH